MWADRVLAAGALLMVFVLVRLAGAVFERRNLRQIAILLVISIAMLIYANNEKPGGYTLEQTPGVIVSVAKSLF